MYKIYLIKIIVEDTQLKCRTSDRYENKLTFSMCNTKMYENIINKNKV